LEDLILQFCTVESSSLQKTPDTDETTAVLYHVEGIDGIDDEDTIGEGDIAPVYGALGIVSRPLEPTGENRAEVVCIRTADGLIPIATKDLRLRMAGNGPGVGTVAMVGYSGGFYSLSPVDGELNKGTIHVLYCPYNPDGNGVYQKAHVITLDPSGGNESISIVHGDGMAITMSASKEIVIKNSDGSSTITIDDSGITMTGQINLAGSVVVGNPLTAVPLLAGAASPPCSTLFVSP